jgi:hypothetical protein
VRQCDIKAAGGFLVTPPSIRPSGAFAGRRYTFGTGSWDEIARLPTVRPGSLPTHREAAVASRERIPMGRRNNEFFHRLLWHAPGCDDFNSLRDVAQYQNGLCDPPLSDVEMVRTAQSAWRY